MNIRTTATLVALVLAMAGTLPAMAEDSPFGNCQMEAGAFEAEFGAEPAAITSVRWAPDGKYAIVSTDQGSFRAYRPDAPRILKVDEEWREELLEEITDWTERWIEIIKDYEDEAEYLRSLLDGEDAEGRGDRLLSLYDECEVSSRIYGSEEPEGSLGYACRDIRLAIEGIFPDEPDNLYPGSTSTEYDPDASTEYLFEEGYLEDRKWERLYRDLRRIFDEAIAIVEDSVERGQRSIEAQTAEREAWRSEVAIDAATWQQAFFEQEYAIATLAEKRRVWITFRTAPFKGMTGFWAVTLKDQGVSCIEEDFPFQLVVADDELGTLPDGLKEAARRYLEEIGEDPGRVFIQHY